MLLHLCITQLTEVDVFQQRKDNVQIPGRLHQGLRRLCFSLSRLPCNSLDHCLYSPNCQQACLAFQPPGADKYFPNMRDTIATRSVVWIQTRHHGATALVQKTGMQHPQQYYRKECLESSNFLIFFLGLSSLDPRMEMTPDPKRRQVVIQIGKILSFKSISYNQFLPGQVNEPF